MRHGKLLKRLCEKSPLLPKSISTLGCFWAARETSKARLENSGWPSLRNRGTPRPTACYPRRWPDSETRQLLKKSSTSLERWLLVGRGRAISESPCLSSGNYRRRARSRQPRQGKRTSPGVKPFTARFEDVAAQAGLTSPTIFGERNTWKYILETTGCGAAFYDYDNDGWQDIFLVNGQTLAGTLSPLPTNRLLRNNRDGTFTDMTAKAGLVRSGWGQGVCIGDYDNDGFDDVFVTYWGHNILYHNNGDGTFTDVTKRPGFTRRISAGVRAVLF